ncbi:MAG: NADH-quinone oxidoreductase subunit NuoE [Tissierellia bacterium]|nr:NADH-quinone oxidoreductase subunit NuoE [Tissierellia bacterium]
MEFRFDLEANKEKIEEFQFFMKENKNKKGALMMVLHKAQSTFGYLPNEIQEMISREMKIPVSEIYGVITFYSQFTLVPKGEYDIGICLGTACYVRGAQEILDEIEKELGITVGQTTPDGKFSISGTRCLGACGLAPVIVVNDDVHGRLKPEDIKDVLNKYR